jgi:hypothetical protein
MGSEEGAGHIEREPPLCPAPQKGDQRAASSGHDAPYFDLTLVAVDLQALKPALPANTAWK